MSFAVSKGLCRWSPDPDEYSRVCLPVSLIPVDGGWQLYCLQTILEEFIGFESVDLRGLFPKDTPPTHATASVELQVDDSSVADITDGISSLGPIPLTKTPELPTHFNTLVIGGGQSGLCAAGYLKSLDISYLIVEKNNEVGDNWKSRYGSLKVSVGLVGRVGGQRAAGEYPC